MTPQDKNATSLALHSQHPDSVTLGFPTVEPMLGASSGHWAAGCRSALVLLCRKQTLSAA